MTTTRLLQLSSPAFTDKWHATELWGIDALSQPFEYIVTAQTNSRSINLLSLNQKPVTLVIGVNHQQHIINGLIYHIKRLEKSLDGWQTVQLTIAPSLRFLADVVDSRVYAVESPQSIPDIVKAVLKNNGITDSHWQLQQDYPKLTLSVQYNESAYNYIHRLLARAGIYYYFTHIDGQSIIVFTDNPAPNAASGGQLTLLDFQSHTGFSHSKSSSQLSDFKTPSDVTQSQQQGDASRLSNQTLEQYHYGHHHPDDTQAQLDAHNKRHMQASQLISQYQLATSHYPQLQAGSRFSLTKQTDKSQNGDYYVAGIVHHAIDHSGRGSHQQDAAQHYENTFITYQKNQSFVPEARLVTDNPLDNRYQQCQRVEQPAFTLLPVTEPHIRGLHTATVVGPKDTPIYTDKYGRLKVQFDWDAHSKNDENSFAWVRCAQTFAGDGYGFHTIPRVGQEVLVSFDHGMPDKPIIVSPIPNDTALPPFTPDNTPTQTGFQSRSLDSDAPAPGGHQVIFEDDAKQPFVKIHAQRDMQLTSLGDFTQTVGGKHTTTVTKGDYTHTAGGTFTLKAKDAVHLVNGQSRISVTSSDIIVEADEIEMGKGSGSAPSLNTAHSAATTTASHSATAQAANQSSATPTSDKNSNINQNKNQPNGYPSAEVKIADWESSLERNLGMYKLTTKSVFNANLKANNKNSVNPLTFDKESFKVEAKNEVIKVFSDFKITKPSTIFDDTPSISLSNDYGVYEFQLTTITTTPNVKQFTGTVSKSSDIKDGSWDITGEMSIDMTVTLTKNNPEAELLPSLAHDLEHSLDKIRQFFHTGFDTATNTLQHATPVVAVAIIAVMILAAPVGA